MNTAEQQDTVEITNLVKTIKLAQALGGEMSMMFTIEDLDKLVRHVISTSQFELKPNSPTVQALHNLLEGLAYYADHRRWQRFFNIEKPLENHVSGFFVFDSRTSSQPTREIGHLSFNYDREPFKREQNVSPTFIASHHLETALDLLNVRR